MEKVSIENCFVCGEPTATYHNKPIEKSMVIPFCKDCKRLLFKPKVKKGRGVKNEVSKKEIQDDSC